MKSHSFKKPALFLALSLGLAACGNNAAVKPGTEPVAPKAATLGLPSEEGVFVLDLNKVEFDAIDDATKARLGTEKTVRVLFKDGSALSYTNTGGENSAMLMEGDIAINRSSKAYDHIRTMVNGGGDLAEQGLSRFGARKANWANNTIPYYWTRGTYNAREEQVIRSAIEHWNKQAGQYVKWEWNPNARHAVQFIKGEAGSCGWSYVGSIGGHQQLSITCFGQHTVMHEMGHAAGLWHEHQRCDRDKFVSIPSGYLNDPVNFGKNCNIAHYGAFDYDSIMNYGNPFVYAVQNPAGKYTGNPRNLGSFPELSRGDLEALRISYTGENGTRPTPPAPVVAGDDVKTGTIRPRELVYYPKNQRGYFDIKTTTTLKASLTGPSNTDLDLHLQVWNGQGWQYIRSSNGPTSNEEISYTVGGGSFRWVVFSHKGTGEYKFKSNY